MIKSMTGFGKARTEIDKRLVGIGIKSLNSKNLDFSLKAPSIFREKELEIRKMVSEQLIRGKVELNIYFESGSSDGSHQIDRELFVGYFKEMEEMRKELNVESDLFPIIARFPDVLKTNSDELTPENWESLKVILNKAISDLDDFRKQEGASMEKDISHRIDLIEKGLKEISTLDPERSIQVKERIKSKLEDFDTENVNEDRLEQELIYYLEKLDITEEKTRLAAHCIYFKETVSNGHSEGKKLNFISQEIGREINTIGSKANHAGIQKIVVQMKDELEKIKEQLLNVL